MRRGIIVFGAGTLLSMTGFAMAMRELAAALRKYTRAMPVPPSDLARYHARLAKSAAAAGATAWREAHRATPPGMIDLTTDSPRHAQRV